METPLKVICDGCGHILYYGEDLVPPEDITRQSENRCPKCGGRLEIEPSKITILRMVVT